MHFRLLSVILVFLILAGCATTRKESADLEIQHLQSRIRQLQRETQEKDKKISYLEYELDGTRTESKKVIYSEHKAVKQEGAKSHKSTSKNIQTALKKAGFYKGFIDGKIGRATKRAIVDFQRANGLRADGVVGKKTWVKLSKFLN